MLKYCLGQALDSQVTGDDLFKSRLELFKVIIQDYRESFRRLRETRGSFCVDRCWISFIVY